MLVIAQHQFQVYKIPYGINNDEQSQKVWVKSVRKKVITPTGTVEG